MGRWVSWSMVGGFNQIQRENEAVKNRVTRDIRNLFEHKEDGNYYKPGREGNFWSKIYIEYESNGDTNKALLKIMMKYVKCIKE